MFQLSKRFIQSHLTWLSVGLIVGCVVSEGGNDFYSVHPNSQQAEEDFQGTWRGECASEDGYGSINSLKNARGTSVLGTILYDDLNCTVALLQVNSEYFYQIGDTLSLQGSQPATRVNFELFSNRATILNSSLSSLYNEQNFCGRDNWRVNDSYDVDFCASTEDIPVYIYDIFLIEGNKLYLGDSDSGDGLTEITRPREIDYFEGLSRL